MDRIELIDKRKPREKHFLQKDGTIRAEVFNEDVHYLKDGKYEEIDNTLIKQNDSLVNKSNKYKVEFKENIKESLMKISRDNYYIDFKIRETSCLELKCENRNLVEENKNITSTNITDDITIQYKVLSNKVKETIVLQNANHSRMSFKLDTNLSLKEKNGEILAVDKTGNSIFIIEKPYMIDSRGIINEQVYYSIESYEDAYVLNLILDDEWLMDKDRKYPVFVDPTIIDGGSNLSSYDTYIYEGDTNVSRGSLAYLKAGVEKVNNVDRINRTLIKFELPEIGTGSEIVGAYLSLVPYISPTNNQNAQTYLVEAHRITEDWNESTANWQTMNNKYDERVEAISEFTRGYIQNNTLISNEISLSITNLVKNWYRDTPNYGVLIKSTEEAYVDDDFPEFFSKDNNMSGNPKPTFAIVYINQNGIENYLEYKKQSFELGTTYINAYNGNMTGLFSLGQTIGGQLPVELKLVYNTNDVILNNNVGLGKGYKLNYLQKLKKVTINNEELLEYEDGDGTLHYFYRTNLLIPESEELYKDEDGLNLEITLNNNNYILSDKTGNKKKFVANGNIYYLTEITDKNDNKIIITFDNNNKITKLKDINNAEVNITYATNSITITSPNESATINYTNNKISSITKNNRTMQFLYNINDIIESIIDPSLMKICYEYYSELPYKIKKVTQYGNDLSQGQYFSFEYGNGSTNIVDNKLRNETLIFNNYGRVLSANSLGGSDDIKNAYSYNRQYGYSLSDKNNIVSKASPTGYIKNYLKNTGFENGQDFFTINGNNITKEITTDYAYTGDKSLKVVSTGNDTSIIQQVSLNKDNYYTFSGYFKSNNPITIALSYTDEHGITKKSEEVIESSSEFVRNDVSIFYEPNSSNDFTISIELNNNTTLYIDDIQLEKGEIANTYNIIENSDFTEGYSDWDTRVYKEMQEITTISDFYEIVNINSNNDKALKVKMKPDYVTVFKKRFYIKGNENDLYTISFWYKNEGIAPIRPYAGNSVTINFHPADGSAEYCVVQHQLNTDPYRWQYFTFRERALEDFDYIDIIFYEEANANNFYITDISFFRNQTSGDFSYDNNGNLIFTKNQSNEENHFTYNNSKLIKATTSTGDNYKYEYDKNLPNLMINAISPGGICNEIIYNSQGNPISNKVSKKINETITEGTYKIRSKGTRKYIKIINNMVYIEQNDCSNTLLHMVKVGDNYKIYSAILDNYYLTYQNSILKLSNTESAALFSISQRDDGSYNIAVVENNNIIGYLKVNNSEIIVGNIDLSDTDFDFYIETANNMFIENTKTYDTDNRFIESSTDSCFNTTNYETNSVTGNVSKITTPNNVSTEYTYDSNNRVTKVEQNNEEMNFLYNSQNNLINKISLGNLLYKFEYDSFLNLKKVYVNENNELINYTYENNNGNLLSKAYGNNQTVSYGYDLFDRIKTQTRSDNTYNYKYDNNGNIARIISNNHKEKYYYDISNRLNKYIDGNYKRLYKYDQTNDISEKKYILQTASHTTNYLKENDIAITKIEYDNVNDLEYEYDELGRIIKKTLPNGIQILYKYVSWGKKTSYLIESITIGNNVYKYKYDSMNNINEVLYNNSTIKKYYYNNYNELEKEEDFVSNEGIEYQYLYGNIVCKTKKDLTNNTIIATDSYEYNNNTWRDILTKYNNTIISSDTIGNMTAIGTATLTWENGILLSGYSDSNLSINYKYDSNGTRESKTVNNQTTDYYLDGEKIIYEARGSDILYYLYDLSGIIGLEYDNQKYYYIKNIQGDIIGITNSNGNIIANYKYDSWGNIISITDNNDTPIIDLSNIAIINPFRYRSYYYDTETGLYYLNRRYYNPVIGRFINPDETINANKDFISFNLFAYASNNPINYTDYSGTLIGSLLKAVFKTTKIYRAIKTVITVASNIYLAVKGYSISRDMFNKSMYNPTGNISTKNQKQIISGVASSSQAASSAKTCVSQHKDETSFSNCLGYKDAYYDNGDLQYSIQHIDIYVSGTKKSDNEWDLTYSVTDDYDFMELKPLNSTANIANDLGWVMQKTGLLDVYTWSISFNATYKEE